jgi:hypothetical protein
MTLAVRPLVSRTDAGPLRRVWALGYELTARALARWLTRGERDGAAYVRGSVATGTAVHGVSDIDLVVVLADASPAGSARRRVSDRWQRALASLPALGDLATAAAYEQTELDVAAAAPALSFGLDGAPPGGRLAPPLFHRRPALDDPLWLRVRPGLYGATADWRRLRGPERRPPARPRSEQDQRIAAWLELQWWWRHAIAACVDPSGPRTRYLLVKFVSEPLRILLWLEHGERIDDRRAALQRGLEAMPEEEEAIRAAISLIDELPHEPSPPLGALLPVLVRLSRRIAALLGTGVADAGVQEVRLLGAAIAPRGPAPLLDWRAVALAEPPQESLLVKDGDLSDPGAIATRTRADTGASHPALRDGGLMLVAMRDLWRSGFLRTLQCPLTDPVSFALLDGDRVARFPNARGWSVGDLAARALAEHAPLLAGPPPAPGAALALAISAARAALLAESLADGEPVLALAPLDVARLLAERGGEAGRSARAAEAGLRDGEADGMPDDRIARDLLASVASLPAYTPAP